MSEQWTWTYQAPDGGAMSGEGLSQTPFPTQSDAESWFGEVWHELAERGVGAVTLHRDGEKVYGPMSLEPTP